MVVVRYGKCSVWDTGLESWRGSTIVLVIRIHQVLHYSHKLKISSSILLQMTLTKMIPWWFTAKPCKTFQAILINDTSTVSSRSESFKICIFFFTFPTWCPSPQPTQAEPERWSRKWPWKRKPWRFGGVKNLEAFEKKGGCQPPQKNLTAHRQGYRVATLHMGNGWVTL